MRPPALRTGRLRRFCDFRPQWLYIRGTVPCSSCRVTTRPALASVSRFRGAADYLIRLRSRGRAWRQPTRGLALSAELSLGALLRVEGMVYGKTRLHL